MTPNPIECPTCHTPNSATETPCTRCETPLPLSGDTFLGKASPDNSTFTGEARTDDVTFLGDAIGGDVTDLSGAKGWSRPARGTFSMAFRGGRIAPGSLLGTRYEIVQLLGEGGMIPVFLGNQRHKRKNRRCIATPFIETSTKISVQTITSLQKLFMY